MQSASQLIFAQWSPPPILTGTILLTALIYTRGWYLLRKTRPEQFATWRLLLFHCGLGTLWIAIASPLDGFADALLSAHMIKHLLLMSFVPPLILLSLPVVPLLRGLPGAFSRTIIAPLVRLKALRKLGHWLITPIVAWLAMNLTFVGWHIPAAYDFALEHETWHDIEHLCFLGTSILSWWPLIRPWPTRSRSLGWLVLPYLVMADIVNTMVSGFLAFCERPVYAYYQMEPNAFGIDLMVDQRAGAAAMWVIGSAVFLLPVMVSTLSMLQRQPEPRTKVQRACG